MSCAPPGSCSRSLSRPRGAAKYVSRWLRTPWSRAPSARAEASEATGSGSRALSSRLRRTSSMALGGTLSRVGGRVGSARMEGLHVVDHPLLSDHVAELRAAGTSREAFRRALGEASAVLAYEAMRDLATVPVTIATPLEETEVRRPALP